MLTLLLTMSTRNYVNNVDKKFVILFYQHYSRALQMEQAFETNLCRSCNDVHIQ